MLQSFGGTGMVTGFWRLLFSMSRTVTVIVVGVVKTVFGSKNETEQDKNGSHAGQDELDIHS